MAKKRKVKEGLYKRPDSRFWWMSYTNENGKRVMKSTGQTLKEKAKAVLEDTKAAVRRGESTAEGTTRVENLSEDYFTYCTEQGERNVKGKRGIFKKWIIPQLGSCQLRKLRTKMLMAFRSQLVRSGLSNSSCNRTMSTLRDFVNWATMSEHCSAAVLAQFTLKKLHEPPPKDKHLTVEQYLKLVEAAPPLVRAVLAVLVNTGARIGEVVHNKPSAGSHPLRWDQVQFDTGMIELSDGKGKDTRYAPINTTLAKVLNEVPRHIRSPFVFADPTTGEAVTYNQLRTLWEQTRTDASMPHVCLHDIRHTAASWAAQEGESLGEIGKVLGHKDLSTTQRYAHLVPGAVRSFGDRVEKHSYVIVTSEVDPAVGEET
jgi:integrase